MMKIKSYSKGPEAEDDDDEVNGVGEEHEDINISDCAVFWLDESSEELKDRMVERHTPNTERERERQREGLYCPLIMCYVSVSIKICGEKNK